MTPAREAQILTLIAATQARGEPVKNEPIYAQIGGSRTQFTTFMKQ